MSNFFFDNWSTVTRTIFLGSLSYIGLVFFLRISGKRTLSKMNMFDFIVTIAFGSTLATIIFSKNVSLIQGLVGLGLLVLLQFLITYFEVRSSKFRKIIKSNPSLLYFGNDYLSDVIVRERVGKEEIKAAIRQKGFARDSDIHAVILETNGNFSIIDRKDLTLEELKKDGVIID